MREPPVLTLPFALLMADNHRLIPSWKQKRLVANGAYRLAKAATEVEIMGAVTRQKRWSTLARPRVTIFGTSPVAVHLAFFFPDLRQRDQTNYIKMLHDAMSGIVYEDDRQIDDARQTKALDRTNPRVVITITPLGQQEESA